MLSGETMNANETFGDTNVGKLVKFSDYEKVKNENKILDQEIGLLQDQITDLNQETS